MSNSEIKNLLAAANHVDDFDLGTGGADGKTADSAVTVRQAGSDSDFEFGQIIGQGTPVAPKATASPTPAPAAKASPRASQPATQPTVDDGLTPQQRASNAIVGDDGLSARQRVDRDFAGTITAPPRDDANQHPFLKRALKSSQVKSALKAAQVEQARYRIVLQETGPLIGKEQQAADCLTAIANCSNIAELERLRQTYAETQGPAAEAARQSARRIARHAFTKLESTLHNLIDLTVAELATIKPEIEAAEVNLFAAFGFPKQATGLMNHLTHICGRVSHHKSTLALNSVPERVNSILPGDGSEILETFTA